jgi:hypothetical protein
MIVMIASIFGSFYFSAHFPLILCAAISLSLIIISFITTQLLLERNSRVYRPRGANSFGWNWNWGH